jgi:hypothetical protein
MISQISCLKNHEKFVMWPDLQLQISGSTDVNSNTLFLPNCPPSRQEFFSDYPEYARHTSQLLEKLRIFADPPPIPAKNFHSTSQKKPKIGRNSTEEADFVHLGAGSRHPVATGWPDRPALPGVSRGESLQCRLLVEPRIRKRFVGGFLSDGVIARFNSSKSQTEVARQFALMTAAV